MICNSDYYITIFSGIYKLLISDPRDKRQKNAVQKPHNKPEESIFNGFVQNEEPKIAKLFMNNYSDLISH